jgi:excisionase family DNA binding protein
MKSSKKKQVHTRSHVTARRALPRRQQALLEAQESAQLLKAQQAADFLNVSVNTVRMWIWQKRLPVIRLGRAVRLLRADLERLIEHGREDAVTF